MFSFAIYFRSEYAFYKEHGELIQTDTFGKTLTFRWYPTKEDIFPIGLKMLIHGAYRYFNSIDYFIDMTPSKRNSDFLLIFFEYLI